jgi:hypothetical protein
MKAPFTMALSPRKSRLVTWAAAAVLGVIFLILGVGHVEKSYREIKFDYEFSEFPALPESDFAMFYGGADLIRSSDRANVYDERTIVRHIYAVRGLEDIDPNFSPDGPDYVWQRYYNPPFFLLALSPLTLLDLHTAFLVAIAANVALLVVLAGLLGAIVRWRQPQTLLLALALFGFSPVYFALHHGQPTILLAVILASGYLALRAGRGRIAALLLATMSLKPHWLLPGAATMLKERRHLAVFAIAAFALLVLPFAGLGAGAFLDYMDIVRSRGEADLSNPDYSGALLSWTGFFRALTGEPQTLAWLLASAATVAAYAVLWLRGDDGLALAGGVLTTLLIVPHTHPQDWVLVAPVAAILLARTQSPVALAGTAVGLLAIFAAANDWPREQASMSREGQAVYWVTLAAFGLLVWLAAVELVRFRQKASDGETISQAERMPAQV